MAIKIQGKKNLQTLDKVKKNIGESQRCLWGSQTQSSEWKGGRNCKGKRPTLCVRH